MPCGILFLFLRCASGIIRKKNRIQYHVIALVHLCDYAETVSISFITGFACSVFSLALAFGFALFDSDEIISSGDIVHYHADVVFEKRKRIHG